MEEIRYTLMEESIKLFEKENPNQSFDEWLVSNNFVK